MIYEKIYLSIYLSIYISISLNGQIINSNEIEKGTNIQRNASFNVEEIKVRWKKAALENCPGIPCEVAVVTPPTLSFTCGTSTVKDVDGNAYETVSIVGTGVTQCWTKSNLKVTKYNDGTLIPDLTNSLSSQWAQTLGARTEYVANGVTGYVGTFGYLYNWYAVTDSRKLCPDSWHVPTDPEWTIMLVTLDPSQAVNSGNVSTFQGVQSAIAGTVMKSTITNTSLGSGLGWNPGSPGTNTIGFSALPGGYRSNVGSFFNIRNFAFFWSATVYDNTTAWFLTLSSSNGNVYRNKDVNSKSFGASVRCLRD